MIEMTNAAEAYLKIPSYTEKNISLLSAPHISIVDLVIFTLKDKSCWKMFTNGPPEMEKLSPSFPPNASICPTLHQHFFQEQQIPN